MSIFEVHSLWFLVGLALVPRITLLAAGTLSGEIPLAWVGWVVHPRMLVAVLALPYWETNPFLVLFAWFLALLRWEFRQKGNTWTCSYRINTWTNSLLLSFVAAVILGILNSMETKKASFRWQKKTR